MTNLYPYFAAEKEAKTKGENQTPVHFAARNDACQSLKALVKLGCKYKDERDYKMRTPLHLAAELGKIIQICSNTLGFVSKMLVSNTLTAAIYYY